MTERDLEERAQGRIGTVLRGKYRLDRVLGHGGMAVVFAATHRNLKRFAVKMLHPELSIREEIRKRFLREGYVGNKVDHPGAVAVLDDDVTEDGAAFLVMELLDGVGVDVLWEQHGRRLPVTSVLAIATQLLDVLVAAHGKGIVHRDIKPANLLLLRDGTLKVLDFGIARVREVAGSDQDATSTGAIMGTPAYMAPEQALAISKDIDGRTDVWAVGATIFSLLSGRTVHEGENASQVLVQAATKPARSLAPLRQDLDERVVAIVARALEFEKDRRWPSALDMKVAVEALENALSGGETSKQVLQSLMTKLAETQVAQTLPEVMVGGPAASVTTSAPLVAPLATERALPSERAPSIEPAPPTARKRAPALAIAAIATLVAVGGVLGSRELRSHDAPVAKIADSGAATQREGRAPSNATAALAYEAAIQAERDGRTGTDGEEHQNLAAAVAADPGLAAAYLRLTILDLQSDKMLAAREEYRKTADHRRWLGEVDAAIFESLDPLLRAPPSQLDYAQAITKVAARYRSEPYPAALAGFAWLMLERPDEALVEFNHALAADPTWSPALFGRAGVMHTRGDTEGALHAYGECLRIAPSNISCLWMRLQLFEVTGRCEEMRSDAVRGRALAPKDQAFGSKLAAAAFALGDPTETIDDLTKQADALLQPDERAFVEATDGMMVAIGHGDFLGADAFAKQAEAIASEPNRAGRRARLDRPRLQLALDRFFIAEESGELAAHRGDISATRAHVNAWAGTHDRYKMRLSRFEAVAGLITRDELHARRDRVASEVLAASMAKPGEDPAPEFHAWRDVVAITVDTADEARHALEAWGRIPVIPPYERRDPDVDFLLGKLYVLAGRYEEARVPLQTAASACDLLHDPFIWDHALGYLGEALEHTGDIAGARAAYEKVLSHWGKAKPRSITADRARARLAALPR